MKLGAYCLDVLFSNGSDYTITLYDVLNVEEYDVGV